MLAIEKVINLNNYITINFHYWGIKEEEKNIYIDKIHKILNFILENTNYSLVFIPMHITDKNSFDDYIVKYPNQRLICFNYDYNFRKIRRVIADSKICITMKHHPIIFAVGEDIPVISLNFSDYYVHKNIGALMQYKQEKFSINFEDELYLKQFIVLFQEIESNLNDCLEMIKRQKIILNNRKQKFLNMIDNILYLEKSN